MSVRKAAFLVGVDDYRVKPLSGCVNDVAAMEKLLSRNEDGSPNFQCLSLTAPRSPGGGPEVVTRSSLRRTLEEVLAKRVDMALFYFSGHGTITSRGGLLVSQDVTRDDEGVPMSEIVAAANESKIEQVTIIVDACFSGQLGGVAAVKDDHAVLREGVAIIAASSPDETSMERAGRGVFTSLVCGALEGGAADVMGEVTSASIYAYAEQALGPLDQRPMYKANVARLSPLRTCRPIVEPAVLRKLSDYFATADYVYHLDPAYEPDRSQHPKGTVPDPAKEAIFGHLQQFRAARLLEPVAEAHMYFAAMRSKSCRLTPLGRFYWKRAKDGRL